MNREKLELLLKELKITLRGHSATNLKIAEYLYNLRKDEGWRELKQYDTWKEFCMNVGWSVSKVNQYANTYEKLVVELNTPLKDIECIDMSNLRELIPYINEKNKEELIGKANDCTNEDLRAFLKTMNKTLSELMDCVHKWDYWVGRVCSECQVKESKKVDGVFKKIIKTIASIFTGKPPEKKTGIPDPNITDVVEFLRKMRGIEKLDGSGKANRNYAKLALDKLNGDKERLKNIIRQAMNDKYDYKNATKMSYIYYNLAKIETDITARQNLTKLAELKTKHINKGLEKI